MIIFIPRTELRVCIDKYVRLRLSQPKIVLICNISDEGVYTNVCCIAIVAVSFEALTDKIYEFKLNIKMKIKMKILT